MFVFTSLIQLSNGLFYLLHFILVENKKLILLPFECYVHLETSWLRLTD